jgi:hypothetical protein
MTQETSKIDRSNKRSLLPVQDGSTSVVIPRFDTESSTQPQQIRGPRDEHKYVGSPHLNTSPSLLVTIRFLAEANRTTAQNSYLIS